ncbi:MAG: cupin domain-containing protein [Actinomycetota bacterium]|nr:cupin domain-containing protein [Acidimicrobiales bacterium]MEC7900031.1 cupin domain-containing protein [Actinomycetota bacterium]|tara:strand:- start:7142 stop:7636 length:495 start_codon:yes stop_codon:yes gene_type:complete
MVEMSINDKTPEEISQLLGLEPLPHEGGMWTQTLKDSSSTAIYYLLSENDFSAMHKLESDEVYHYYAGDPARMLLLNPDGSIDEPILGSDLEAGERPQVIVGSGVWQGSSTTGNWTLLGTTMSPPYSQDNFHLGDRQELVTNWPDAHKRIHELTRDELLTDSPS